MRGRVNVKSGDTELPVFTISFFFFFLGSVYNQVAGIFLTKCLQVSLLTCLGAFMSPYFKKTICIKNVKSPFKHWAVMMIGFLCTADWEQYY